LNFGDGTGWREEEGEESEKGDMGKGMREAVGEGEVRTTEGI